MDKDSILSEKEWLDLRNQVQELFDITLKYTELVAKESDRIWDQDRPNFYKKDHQTVDEALADYQEVLNDFHEDRKRAYLQNFNRVKSDSIDRVAQIEKYLERLSNHVGGCFHLSDNSNGQ